MTASLNATGPDAEPETDEAASLKQSYRVLLVDNDSSSAHELRRTLQEEGHKLLARLDGLADLVSMSRQLRPDVICVDIGHPDDAFLQMLAKLDQEAPRPVVVFAGGMNHRSMRLALRAGVSVYIADDLRPRHLLSVLDIACARFELMLALRTELDHAKTRLADQRDIERAKGLLMKRRCIDEAAAYGLLRKMAMNRKQRIGELARTVLAAADMI